MKNIALTCTCEKVQGIAHDVTPESWNRIICHCSDCQSFAKFLEKEDMILDDHKWTDIFQMSLSKVEITEGRENIKCIRLTEKWLYRWYADCCKTPIGNTMWAKMSFMWVIHNFMGLKYRDESLGPVRAYAFLKTNTDDRQATPPFRNAPKNVLQNYYLENPKKRYSIIFFQ